MTTEPPTRHWLRFLATAALLLATSLAAQPITALRIEQVTPFYDQPYLLDFNFALRDQNEKALILDPAQIKVVCAEDGAAISASETGFRLFAAANKQLKCFLVLDYTLSMADPAVNGDSDGDGLSDAIETSRYYPALTIPQLAERFQQISDDLRGNYVLRWATLKRSGSFTPSFSLTYQGLSDSRSGPTYYPGNYAGDVLQGRLVFDAALDEGEATLGLYANYVPRFITRVRFQYASDKPLTVQKVPVAEGGIVPDTWVFEHNPAERWIELHSPTPQNIFTALNYATQGKLSGSPSRA